MSGYDWLSAGYGMAAFVLSAAVWHIFQRSSIPVQKQHYQDRVMQLLKRKLDLQAEQIGIDEELAELWMKAPEPRARWIIQTIEEARLIPARLFEMAYRYGFAVPSPQVVWQEYGGQPQETDGSTLPRSGEAAAAPVIVPTKNAWGQPLN